MADPPGKDSPIALLPADWQTALGDCAVEPVAAGMSDAAVFRIRAAGVPDRYLKVASGGEAAALRREIERTAWLGANGIAVPRILRAHDSRDLVAVMTAALTGVAIEDCARPPHEVVAILAHGLAGLHALPALACPFDEGIGVRLARAHALVAGGLIDPKHFAERNRDCSPREILDRARAHRPACEDQVVVHGDATFANLWIIDGCSLGFLDCSHAGRSDRYLDLGLIVSEIEESFGAEWIEVFLRSYGIADWDAAKASFFADLYELF